MPPRRIIRDYLARQGPLGKPSLIVTTAAKIDPWRTKYYDSLAVLDAERERFAAILTALKRIAGRVCSAALGQSRELDELLHTVQSLIRTEPSADALDEIMPALTQAIQNLDARPQNDAPATVDRAVTRTMSAVLDELRGDPGLDAQIAALDARLANVRDEELPGTLTALCGLVEQRIHRLDRAKREVEVLLGDMVDKLEEINRFVVEQRDSHKESQTSSETLKLQITGEMQAIGLNVAEAHDLPQLRTQVRQRLDTIDRYLQEFREREAALAATLRARDEQMTLRIAELEARAHRLHEQLKNEQRQSLVDPLTRVANRLAYERRIEDELNRHRRFGHATCLAVWDVDHFKRINDSYGHRAGDRVLQATADCLSKRLRATDFIARYGGEEFVMILPGTTLDDALRICDELRLAVTRIAFQYRGSPVGVTASVGLTPLQASDTPEAAFDRADMALYRAKQNGRNRIERG
jgi:diguanylate cyclase